MAHSTSDLHIYERDIRADERTSLAVLTARIAPGARVLDLGCGSGAVGRFLAQRDGTAAGPVDGLTISDEEAALAAPHYRRVELANLDACTLGDLFSAQSYDVIVCADVLEHTRHPERVLVQCRELLAAGGQALLSIPNAGYCGLVAELMAGDFRYRKEGLLDETHLRFFTRRALLRFLAEGRWAVDTVETITRALPTSEFSVPFDTLPPAVARYLLALPDALTYQFIVATHPAAPGETLPAPESFGPAAPLPAQALFTSELYLGAGGGHFSEARKLSASGVIGNTRQTLTFELPAEAAVDALKFDPADRAGFLYLYGFTLCAADGSVLWRWSAADADALLAAPHDGVVPQPGWWPDSPFLLLLHGSDPWIQLPVPAAALAHAAGGRFRAEVGWPMSADYLALAGVAHAGISAARNRARAAEEQTRQRAAELSHQLQANAQATAQNARLHTQNAQLRTQKTALLAQLRELSAERDEARALVHDIETSTMFRATRPIVHAKIRFDRLLGIGLARPQTDTVPVAHPIEPSAQPVDVIVPVYKGLGDTRRCVESVLASTCQTPWRLILINDASPEPEVTDYLRAVAPTDERITLLENAHNLGFVGTVNRGMALSADHDVLLLNSDTEVAPGWLDRIRAAAYCDRQVATVTPFSNNATICSYPRFCEDNDLPAGWDTARLDALFARTNPGQVVDVPSGVGFCMYVRRAALAQVGLFDTEHFGKGYGEENDFCIRAAAAGWRNLHALDVFVRHYGGVSFGASKSPRERAAMETLRRLHPRYEAGVLKFIARDPARPARIAVDIARIRDGKRPVILAVLHDRGGGTERHVREIAAALHERAQFLLLKPRPRKAVSLQLPGAKEGFELAFDLPQDEDALLAILRQLGVVHIHFHHLLGHGEFVRRLPQRLGVAHDFTAHDYWAICPEVTLTDASGSYCAAADGDECAACLAHVRSSGKPVDLPGWRQRNAMLLNDARHVIAPSRDTLARLLRYFPGAPLALVPHTDLASVELPAPQPRALDGERPLQVAVIGALSIIKGADTLEDAAVLARKTGAPVEFHLLGFGYRAFKTQPHANLTVHGAYEEADLPALLAWLQPDLVWFPARWPETYSYTLSACLAGGWPVVAPDIGAFPERLAGRTWSWVAPWNRNAPEWLDFFTHVRAEHFQSGTGPAPLVPAPLVDCAETTRSFAPQPPSWYATEYLSGIEAVNGAEPSMAAIAPFIASAADDFPAGVRGHALGALARLRSLPVLAPVARAIPPHWQTRVKSWLRK